MVAKVNVDDCTGCGICLDECPSEAISLNEEIAVVMRTSARIAAHALRHVRMMLFR